MERVENPSKESEDSVKKPYTKPVIRSESVFVTTASCGKCESGPVYSEQCNALGQTS